MTMTMRASSTLSVIDRCIRKGVVDEVMAGSRVGDLEVDRNPLFYCLPLLVPIHFVAMALVNLLRYFPRRSSCRTRTGTTCFEDIDILYMLCATQSTSCLHSQLHVSMTMLFLFVHTRQTPASWRYHIGKLLSYFQKDARCYEVSSALTYSYDILCLFLLNQLHHRGHVCVWLQVHY